MFHIILFFKINSFIESLAHQDDKIGTFKSIFNGAKKLTKLKENFILFLKFYFLVFFLISEVPHTNECKICKYLKIIK